MTVKDLPDYVMRAVFLSLAAAIVVVVGMFAIHSSRSHAVGMTHPGVSTEYPVSRANAAHYGGKGEDGESYASFTTIPLTVIPNPMRKMAFRNVDAVKRDADREARRASSSISTLLQMGWSKGNRLDHAQIGRMFKS